MVKLWGWPVDWQVRGQQHGRYMACRGCLAACLPAHPCPWPCPPPDCRALPWWWVHRTGGALPLSVPCAAELSCAGRSR